MFNLPAKDLTVKQVIGVLTVCYFGKAVLNSAVIPLNTKLAMWSREREALKAQQKRDEKVQLAFQKDEE